MRVPGGAPLAWVWGVRGRALSHPRLPALWVCCRVSLPTGFGCGWVRAWGPVTNPTARALASWFCALWGRHEGARGGRLLPGCGASGAGRSPTPDCPPSGRATAAHYPLALGAGGCGRGDPSPTPQRALLRAVGAACGCPGGAPPAWVWGVRGRALSRPRLPALRAGRPGPTTHWLWVRGGAGVGTRHQPHSARCGGGTRAPGGGRLLPVCGASGVGRSPTPDCPPSGRAAGAHYPLAVGAVCGRAGPAVLGTMSRAAVRGALLGRAGRAGLPGAFWCASPFLWPFLLRSLLVRPPPGWGCPVCGCWWVFFFYFFSPSPPRCAPVVFCFACFPAPGALGLGVLSPPPIFFFPPPPLCASLSPALRVIQPGVPWALASCCPQPPPPGGVFFNFYSSVRPLPPPSLLFLAFPASRLPWAYAPPPPFFLFFVLLLFFLLRVCCVCSGVSCRVFPVLPVCCAVRVVRAVSGAWCCWFLVSLPFVGGLLVALVARRCRLVVCVGSGARVWSGCRWASSLWCPVPLSVSCGAVLPCGAVLWCPVFFLCFSPCWWRWFPVVPR